jgi:nicotinamidase-related amidase
MARAKPAKAKRGSIMPALLLIDVQNDFLSRAWRGDSVVENCAKLLGCARDSGYPVVHVRRSYRADGLDVELPRLRRFAEEGWIAVGGTRGAEAPPALKELDGELVVVKPRWSAFFHTELDLLLRRIGADTLVIAGLQTPNCVRATAYDAIALDYRTIVVSDATSAATRAIHVANLGDLRRIGAGVMPTREAASVLGG